MTRNAGESGGGWDARFASYSGFCIARIRAGGRSDMVGPHRPATNAGKARYAAAKLALAVGLCFLGQTAAADCVVLGDLGYVLPVEGDVNVFETENGLTLDLSPGGRGPQLIRLMSLQGMALADTDLPETELLPNGLTARYATEEDEAAGSGGAEVRLSGWLEGEEPLIGIGCFTQTEYGGPEWCLPILGELRPEAEGCEAKEE
jgi:hypothetical protein